VGTVSGLTRVLRCPVLFLDLSLPEHGYHAANEYFEWGRRRRGSRPSPASSPSSPDRTDSEHPLDGPSYFFSGAGGGQ